MRTERGRVVTFYSYKGGTGRSMALANLACLMSRRGGVLNAVLVIDWDLEAPGLHHYFFRSTPVGNGVMELLKQVTEDADRAKPDGPLSEEETQKIVGEIALTDFITKDPRSKVDLILAGKFDSSYAERVTAFDWRGLFERVPTLFRLLAERLAREYDYVFVDSRTGLNDISGICTTLLPDQLVLVFTPNRQSLQGGLDAVRKAADYRRQSDDLRPLEIFPLPSRVDLSEPELLDNWRFGSPDGTEAEPGYQIQFQNLFEDVYELPSCDLKNYFDEVQIQHVPRFSYGEEIAVLIERGTRLSLSRSYAAFADILARPESPWNLPASAQGGAGLVAGADPTSVKVQALKEYLTEERFKLKLRDLLAREVRDVLSNTADDDFPIQGTWSVEEFSRRLKLYETVCADLLRLQALLCFWGEADHAAALTLAPRRLSEHLGLVSGLALWFELRWYPELLLLYSGGIAAVAAGRYGNLRELMLVPVYWAEEPQDGDASLIRSVTRAMSAGPVLSAFKALPGLADRYTPRSDHLYELLHPILDELLFLGKDYEHAFDRFEILYALEHAHRYTNPIHGVWGPPGRFAWKGSPWGSGGEYRAMVAEADAQGPSWPPIKAGLFGGSVDRFKDLATKYEQLTKNLGWL
jgi:MinD-like ATPase involved in chromosome partitioning or flagellar assembly